jgi:serine/threonine protein phosphatase PrpC
MSVDLFESVELSDVGRKRKNNEDSCLRIPGKGVYCIADGMGGAVGGDVASETITTNVHEFFAKALPEQCSTLSGEIELLRAAANKASKWIKEFAEEKAIGQMGSTLVVLVFDPRNPCRAIALHAGDSRLYRLRNGNLEQLTADHTAAAALAAKLGRDLSTFPARYQNELARAVGLKESVELEETKVQVKTGDLFLLCSDGLPRMISDSAIEKVLARPANEELSIVARELVQQANKAGGKDNITVVLVKIGDVSSFANVAPEPETESAAVECATALAHMEVHNPPMPGTVRTNQENAPTPLELPQTFIQDPRLHRDGAGMSQRAPLIIGAMVVFTVGILTFYHLYHSEFRPGGEMMDMTNLTQSERPNFEEDSAARTEDTRRGAAPLKPAAATELEPPANSNFPVPRPTPSSVASVARNEVWTNGVGQVFWTNRLGMGFVRTPSQDIWVETARVTPEQFEQFAVDAKPHPEVTFDRAESFARKLTAILEQKNELPPGCESWHLAIPTPEEWMLAATNSSFLGLKMEQLEGFEWCQNVTPRGPAMICGGFMPARKMFFVGPVKSQDFPQAKIALRLVLVPLGSTPD